jgi:hypothetical protein
MRRYVLLFVFMIAILRIMDRPALALSPSLTPAQNFDLSHWKLQLPVDTNGTNVGNAAEQSSVQLAAGYQSVYFYTSTNDGAMVFWAPNDGATTGGSTHPRSELREELVPGNTGVNWTPNGIHVMKVTCVVSNVPADTKKVCIGQAHEQVSGGPSAIPLVMIMFYSNTIYADVWSDGNVNNSDSYKYGSFNMGTMISYQLAITNGLMSLTIGGSNRTFNLFGTGYTNWQTNTVYFKAGNYNQTVDTCACWNDGARVAFYELTRFHSPAITNQPIGTNAIAGQNINFNVAVSGNGIMSYQWYLNANKLVSATNPSLSVSNVSYANSGNYSVVASDYTGSTTSSVARLNAVYPANIISSAIASNLTSFTVTASGSSNQFYILQWTTNLTPPINWLSVLTNNSGPTGVLSFKDTNTANYNSRFYRISIR